MMHYLTRTADGWIIDREDGLVMKYDGTFTTNRDNVMVFTDIDNAISVFNRMAPGSSLYGSNWAKIDIAIKNEWLTGFIGNLAYQSIKVVNFYNGMNFNEEEITGQLKIICNDKSEDLDNISLDIPMDVIYKRLIKYLQSNIDHKFTANYSEEEFHEFLTGGATWAIEMVQADSIFRDGITIDEKTQCMIMYEKITELSPDDLSPEQFADIINRIIAYVTRDK